MFCIVFLERIYPNRTDGNLPKKLCRWQECYDGIRNSCHDRTDILMIQQGITDPLPKSDNNR